jgi:hypothetical protein
LQRALSPVPADRYPSVSDFVSALSEAPPAAPPVPFERPALAQPEGREGGQRLLRVDRYRDPRTPRRIALSIAVLLALVVLYRVWRPPARAPAPQQIAQPRPTPADPAASPVTTQPESTGDPVRPTPAPRSSRGTTRREPAELFINSTPWGDVYVDDLLVGTTPLASLRVTPGQHTVRIVRDGFQPYEQTISVAPGQRLRLVNIALQDLTP